MESFKGSYLRIVVLSLLEQMGESYGYELCEVIKRKTEGQLKFAEGTIYPLLHELEKKGLVESKWRVSSDEPHRKYVKLTAEGKKILKQERKALAMLLGLIL